MEFKQAPRAAIYSRKSKFTGKGESTENQIEMCKAFLRAKHPDKYNENNILIYEDEGFSGSSLNRPEFVKMMKSARLGGFDTVICYRLDRISRNIGDFAKLIEELGDLNISFISIKEQFDTSSPMGRAMMYIASVFSQLERETIAERIKDNMDELAKSGRWLGGTTPTGYKSVINIKKTGNEKYKQYHSLELIPEEAEKIKLIFDTFLRNRTISGTLKFISKNNIKTKNGNDFTPVTLKGILDNPVYMKADEYAYNFFKDKKANIYAERDDFNGINAIAAFNKTLQRPGKSHKKQDISQWIISVGEHEGIIDSPKWVKAHLLLNCDCKPTHKNNYAILSGIIKCDICGKPLVAKLRSDKKGFYYICPGKSSGECNKIKNLTGIKADAAVLKAISSRGCENKIDAEPYALNDINTCTLTLSKTDFDESTISHFPANEHSIENKRELVNLNVESVTWDGICLKIFFING